MVQVPSAPNLEATEDVNSLAAWVYFYWNASPFQMSHGSKNSTHLLSLIPVIKAWIVCEHSRISLRSIWHKHEALT